MIARLLTLLCVVPLWALSAPTNSGEVLPWRYDQPPNKPYSAEEARQRMTVPDGFTVEVVAHEPDIVNPVAMCFDDRGRIFVTESVEYPKKPAGVGRDRVKILEDADNDGRTEKVTVFAEGLNIPTGVTVGYGGVWVLNAPDLLFIREKDGKEVSREVVVTGFGRTDTHELPNSLTWGPDGWLYGLNGVFNQCKIRSNNGREYKFNCALWRVHPRTHEFQVIAEGTSNPYGLAWDSEGSAIIEACHWANDHLFHFVETGHYQRQAGTFPPFTIPIGSITDHGHQKTAYCGIANLDTDAYPEEFRERICVGNIHGGAINRDRLERDGATYLAKGEADLLNGNDAWFMPVALKVGPDGCLYILDWYDRYHCSQDAARDPEGVDRLKGRLYRLRYKGSPRAGKFDLATETDDELMARLASGNIFFRETAQRLLTERLHASTALRPRLENMVFSATAGRKTRLHALWAFIGGSTLEAPFLHKLLEHSDPTFRAWGVRAAGNAGILGEATKIAKLAQDLSPDVQLQVAIAAPKLAALDAVSVLSDVLQHCGHDKIIPSIAWNNLHPMLETNSTRFVSGINRVSPALATLSSRIVERFLSVAGADTRSLFSFIQLVAEADAGRAQECLSAVSAKLTGLSEADKGRMKSDAERVLKRIMGNNPGTPLFLTAQLLAARLGLAEVDIGSIRERFTSKQEPEGTRLQALEALIAFRDPGLIDVLPVVFATNSPSFLGRVFAALGRMEDPKLAETILREYGGLPEELQPLAVDLIMQRERWARKLLDAVLANKLPKSVLNANHLRKITESNDREALWAVEKAFGKIRGERNPEREKVVAEMREYCREQPGDPARGQAVFRNVCAQCHTLYGEGGAVGPDITGNGRASFEQLLSNILDPSLVIGPAYQVTTIVTKDGRNLTGLITEDNEQRMVIRMPGEGEETVPRNNVKYTRVSKLSMMPEGIEAMLSKKDLADLFAYLSLDKPPTDPTAQLIPGAPPIKRASLDQSRRIRIVREENQLVIHARLPDGTNWFELATYVAQTHKRPYLHPVRDPLGKVVLTEDKPADHPWQHGIFTGFHRVNGFNYWKEDQGQQRLIRVSDVQEANNRVSWRAYVEWVAPDGAVILEEENDITIHAPDSAEAYRIDFGISLRAKAVDVNFGKFFVGGLAVRMPWEKDNPRHGHLNSGGVRGRMAEGKRAAWCTVERPFGGEVYGFAILDDPGNPDHPPSWRVDEQGLINPNISGLADWSIPAGQERRFRYRILTYRNQASQEEMERRFKEMR